MAQVTTGRIYECDGHRQEGHELAANHPVIVVGRQSLIDNQRIAIVVPLTSSRPNHPVHWAVEIEDTNSHAYVRHVKSVHVTKIGGSPGAATLEEIDSIKGGLARELQYDTHECATVLGREVYPGSLWSASIPNARGLSYEGELLILTSNRDTGMAITLAVDAQPRNNPRQSIPVRLENPKQTAFAVTYQVRSVSTEERLTGYRGEISDEHLRLAKSALIRCIEP
jgi:mRNA-degrading endonuclease toxin of MazEF toxin-antitoxin module